MTNTSALRKPDSPLPQSGLRMLEVSGATRIGSSRSINQDTFVISDLESPRATRRPPDSEISVSKGGVLLAVCDGMGGPPAGDVASRLAAHTISGQLRSEGEKVGKVPSESLESAVLAANEAILDEARQHPDQRGMGTTCTAAIVSPERLVFAQVGDSRAYLLREGQLQSLTRDQTVAADLMDIGALEESQLEHFPFRNMLTQALGTHRSVKAVMSAEELREGDRLLLCTDGLYGVVPDDLLAKHLGEAPDASSAVRALVKAAAVAGNPDDVTAVVAICGPLIRPR